MESKAAEGRKTEMETGTFFLRLYKDIISSLFVTKKQMFYALSLPFLSLR